MSELYDALKRQDFYDEYFTMKDREYRENHPCRYELNSIPDIDEDEEWSGYSAYDSALDAVGGEEEFLTDMDWEY